MMDNTDIQINRNNIHRFISLSKAILYIELFLLLVDVYNYLSGIWVKYPSQYYNFLIHIISIPVLVWLIYYNKRFLSEKGIKLPYKSLMYLNLLLFTPFLLTYYYWDLKDYQSSGIFLIYIFVIGFMVRVDKRDFIILMVYFIVFYFSMILFHKITYIDNPSLYINGISAILMYYLIAPNLYTIESESINNKIEISKKNERLKSLNDDLKGANTKLNIRNEELKSELKNKLLLMTHSNNIFDELLAISNDRSKKENQRVEEVKQILRDYNNSSIIDKLEDRFLEVYDDFVKVLVKEYPGLSVSNIKLCIFIKIGLDAKEIAQIKSISPESVRVARSRLYKHFDIDATETTLFSFLNTLGEEE